jgi:hypothetical protein
MIRLLPTVDPVPSSRPAIFYVDPRSLLIYVSGT